MYGPNYLLHLGENKSNNLRNNCKKNDMDYSRLLDVCCAETKVSLENILSSVLR